MKDTSPEIESRYHDLLMSLPGEERFKMACRMFTTAKKLVLASIPNKESMSPGELRVQLFLRFYGNDFDETEREKIVGQLRGIDNPIL